MGERNSHNKNPERLQILYSAQIIAGHHCSSGLDTEGFFFCFFLFLFCCCCCCSNLSIVDVSKTVIGNAFTICTKLNNLYFQITSFSFPFLPEFHPEFEEENVIEKYILFLRCNLWNSIQYTKGKNRYYFFLKIAMLSNGKCSFSKLVNHLLTKVLIKQIYTVHLEVL